MTRWASPEHRHKSLTAWTGVTQGEAANARREGTFTKWANDRADMRTYEDAIYCGELHNTAPLWKDLSPEQKAKVHEQRLEYARTMQEFAKTFCS